MATNKGVPGVKAAVTAAALAATLGGWAVLATKQMQADAAYAAADAVASTEWVVSSDATAVASLPPIPTVVPRPNAPAQSAPAAPAQSVQAAPIAPAPQAARPVTQIRRPITVTRSSR